MWPALIELYGGILRTHTHTYFVLTLNVSIAWC